MGNTSMNLLYKDIYRYLYLTILKRGYRFKSVNGQVYWIIKPYKWQAWNSNRAECRFISKWGLPCTKE
jgi:hypothetical protein